LFQILDFRHRNGVIDYEEGRQAMSDLAAEMLAENPDLAESHLALGRAASTKLKLSEALDAYRQAVALSPGNVDALLALAGVNENMRNFQRASELRKKALEIDPLAVPVLLLMASSYSKQNDCEGVERMRQRILAMNTRPGRISTILANCLARQDEDLEKVITLQMQEPVGFLRHTALAIFYHRIGDQGKADAELAAMKDEYGDAAAFQYGEVYANWGQPGKAVEWLKLSRDTGDPGFMGLYQDPWLEPIHDDPDYQQLLSDWKRRAGVD
jgi:tetratricopeptide (TPR) repeat protein